MNIPELKIQLGEKPTVQMGQHEHPIEFVGEFKSKGYCDKPYKFMDETGELANGVVVEIDPHVITPALYVLRPGAACQEIAIEGDGYSVTRNSQGRLIVQAVGPALEDNPPVQYETGDTHCYIAGRFGLKVLNVTIPPWTPEMEREIKRGSKLDMLPIRFWDLVEGLQRLTKVSEVVKIDSIK